jgi:hypothetical protein
MQVQQNLQNILKATRDHAVMEREHRKHRN